MKPLHKIELKKSAYDKVAHDNEMKFVAQQASNLAAKGPGPKPMHSVAVVEGGPVAKPTVSQTTAAPADPKMDRLKRHWGKDIDNELAQIIQKPVDIRHFDDMARHGSGFGYFGHELRNPQTDAILADIAQKNGMTGHEVFMFGDSKMGRHAMDDASFHNGDVDKIGKTLTQYIAKFNKAHP